VRPEKGLKRFRQVTRYPHLRSDGLTKRHNGGTRAMEDRIMKKIANHKFVPFEHATDVCDNCGKLQEQHAAHDIVMREAIWTFLLGRGYVHSYYGGTNDVRMDEITDHLTKCSIDWRRTVDPKAGTVSEFTDTESEAAELVKFYGTMTCTCGHIWAQRVCIDHMGLGQIIWHVVRGV
jgi:hypothetical protein